MEDESWEASTVENAGVCWIIGRRKRAAFCGTRRRTFELGASTTSQNLAPPPILCRVIRPVSRHAFDGRPFPWGSLYGLFVHQSPLRLRLVGLAARSMVWHGSFRMETSERKKRTRTPCRGLPGLFRVRPSSPSHQRRQSDSTARNPLLAASICRRFFSLLRRRLGFLHRPSRPVFCPKELPQTGIPCVGLWAPKERPFWISSVSWQRSRRSAAWSPENARRAHS
jgi:hypothetical protein